MATKHKKTKEKDDNLDPITGAPGAHPVGAGVGAAVGAGVGGMAAGVGAATAAGAAGIGASVGTAAGPIGTVVGAIAGGVVGAIAGKSVAESIDPTAEDAYWRAEFQKRPYYEKGAAYEDYQPAYQHGWESRVEHEGRSFDEAEADLEREWQARQAKIDWQKARPAVRDAWDRIERSRTQAR